MTVHNSASVTTTSVGGFIYTWPANAQTAAFTFDTAAGIDCARRWFVNFSDAAFLKDLQNRVLQSWGTPVDPSAPPGPLLAVDDYALPSVCHEKHPHIEAPYFNSPEFFTELRDKVIARFDKMLAAESL